MNKVILIGRLTRDPEISYSQSGIARCKFSLAVERNYTNQDGKRPVDFINIVVWRQLAEHCHKYLRKGLMAAVAGRLEISPFETTDGQRRHMAAVVASEVRFLEWSKDKSEAAAADQQEMNEEDWARAFGINDDGDEDLPM